MAKKLRNIPDKSWKFFLPKELVDKIGIKKLKEIILSGQLDHILLGDSHASKPSDQEEGQPPDWIREEGLPPNLPAEIRETAECPIDIYCDAWIPYPRILNPQVLVPPFYHEFAGDTRILPQKGGPCRIWISVGLDLCNTPPLLWSLHDTSTTIGYRYTVRIVRAGQWYSIQVVEVFDTAKASASGMTEKITRLGPCRVEVEISGSAGNPLVLGAPNIDYNYTIILECISDTQIAYQITGSHDGFPSYSIFIGRTQVYFHDAIAQNQTPMSLFPPEEFTVNSSGTVPR